MALKELPGGASLMLHTRYVAPVVIFLVLASFPPAGIQAQQLVKEGRTERLVLVDGESLDGWAVTEGTLKPAPAPGRAGKALWFHIPVDWHAGEPKYPIGWPRCWMKIPQQAQDWSRWERLHFWIYADTSRDTLPSVPLTMLITTIGPRSNWLRDLPLTKGKWTEFLFDYSDLPAPDRVREIKFSISESRYHDGDTVDFYIDDLELLRWTQPTVLALQPLAKVCFADEPALPVMVETLGLPPNQEAPVKIRLLRGKREVAAATVRVTGGKTRISLKLPPGLPPGEYRLAVPTGADKELGADIRLVSSPWQGGEAR